MNGLAEDAELSEDAFDAVQAAMLARTHDKVPLVRVHAAHALHRLQVPTEEDDPVTLELVRLMAADTSADVRLVALKSVGLSRHTLPHIIQRARDVKPEVRKATYAVVGAKLDPKWLSIAQRVALLRDGLRERDDAVRAACVEMVAVHWLRKAVGSASAVIATLDPEAHADVAELAARELVRVAGMPAELAAGAPWRNGAPRLRVEQALLLRVRFEMWAVGSASARAQLDECAPDVPALVGVLSAHAEQPAVLCELLRLARVLDLSDEAGRRMLGAHASALLGSTAHVARPGGAPLAVVALEVLRATHESELALVREVAELISELHDPLDGPDDDAGGEGGAARAPADAAPADAADAADAALADALARGGELKSQLASCVALDDLDAAAMIKRDIRELEEHVAQLEAARAPARRASDANVHALGALRLAHALLASTSCDARTPEIAGLLAAIILPAMQNAAEPVREVAAVCLGLSCSLGAQFASRYWPVLVQAAARDSAPVRAAALRALADVACTWSPAQLSAAAEGGAPGADGQEAAAECARALCRAAVRDGGAAEPEVQAAGAQGACKLLLLGRVDEPLRTPCLASALCALFAAEAAQRALDGDGARSDGANDGAADALGGMCQFVQLFLGAFRASEQRRALAAALVPLARASAAAPRRTAWANIDVERVARLVAFYAGEAACAPLALAIARELWARPDAAYSAALAKGLCALEPSAAPPGDGDEHSRADDALLAVSEGSADAPRANARARGWRVAMRADCRLRAAGARCVAPRGARSPRPRPCIGALAHPCALLPRRRRASSCAHSSARTARSTRRPLAPSRNGLARMREMRSRTGACTVTRTMATTMAMTNTTGKRRLCPTRWRLRPRRRAAVTTRCSS